VRRFGQQARRSFIRQDRILAAAGARRELWVAAEEPADLGSVAEAAGVMLRRGFADLGLHRIIGSCTAQNASSARLLERLGMRQEAHFIHDDIVKGEWREELIYAILDHEWRATSR
jgi:RimJ/RimL family protein N-acetyltransferase